MATQVEVWHGLAGQGRRGGVRHGAVRLVEARLARFLF
jgi:hypothetical protein